jgi:hypothetical protein
LSDDGIVLMAGGGAGATASRGPVFTAGLSEQTARPVATGLTAHDALAAWSSAAPSA